MKFRKRPVVIDAVQFFPGPELTLGSTVNGVHYAGYSDNKDPMYVVKTLEGHMRILPGEWLITGTKNELHSCKPEIFAEIYVPETCGESKARGEGPCQECGHRAEAHPLLDGMDYLK